MDIGEKLAFAIVLSLGSFFVSYGFIAWEAKNWVLFGIGVMFIAWFVSAMVTHIRQSYKIVKKSYHA